MRRTLIASAVALLVAGWSAAQQDPGTLIIAGGGFAGTWDTEIELANREPGPVQGVIFIVGLPLGAPCPPNCTSGGFTLPPNGTVRILASDFIGELYTGPQMIRVTTETEAPLPVIRARVFRRDQPSASAELPVAREEALSALGPSALVFPGVRRSPGVYSNLILEAVGSTAFATAVALVQIFSPEGELLGGKTFPVPTESTFQALTLVDVAGLLGVPVVEGGQVRVTKLSGPGILWGALSTVHADGRLWVSTGANP